MEFEIRRLTPDLFDDYLYLFCTVAFTDYPEWAKFYCKKRAWR